MKTRLHAVAFVVLLGVSLVAADPSYVGKWKLNTAKSQLTGDTVTISKVADGTMTFDGQGFKYSFKTDGKEYPTPDAAGHFARDAHAHGAGRWTGCRPDRSRSGHAVCVASTVAQSRQFALSVVSNH